MQSPDDTSSNGTGHPTYKTMPLERRGSKSHYSRQYLCLLRNAQNPNSTSIFLVSPLCYNYKHENIYGDNCENNINDIIKESG